MVEAVGLVVDRLVELPGPEEALEETEELEGIIQAVVEEPLGILEMEARVAPQLQAHQALVAAGEEAVEQSSPVAAVVVLVF